MSAHDNLSHQQFLQQHADFHKWAGAEHKRLQGTPEGDRVASAREWMEDDYSQLAHEMIRGDTSRPEAHEVLAVPLHEALPAHKDVLDRYRNRGN